MGDKRGEAEGDIIEPVLKQDVLGLLGEEDHGSYGVGSPREEEYGEKCVSRVEHDWFEGKERVWNRKVA
jgi:hypothetical protein